MVVRVDGLIASENVAVGAVLVAWFVAPLAGVKPVTVGGVVSCAAAVVKVHETSAARRFPATSATPVAPPRTRTRYVRLDASAAVGVKVARRFAPS